MNITALGIRPPPAARDNPAVTPELLASSLARYSRSNKGIDVILQSIDWNDPERSVDAIFRFVDYGHASIAGMTGGIPIVIDGCSMFLAYKLFEIAQLCDGQESSSRYIKLDATRLPDPAEIGIPPHLAAEWQMLMRLSFSCYQELFDALDAEAKADPSIVRLPTDADEKVQNRLRKNYALDRARYFIPFAIKTNAACIMTARVWTETIKQLDSLPLPEAHACAEGLRSELRKFTPRLLRHSYPDRASIGQTMQVINHAIASLQKKSLPVDRCPDEVRLGLERTTPPFLPDLQEIRQAFDGKENRYSTVGPAVKRMFVRAAWNNIAIAELRDLNRHRSGYRFSPLAPVGFYLPEGISHHQTAELLDRARLFIGKLITDETAAPAYVYALHLGTQVAFEHSTHLDKFIYEIELRTGMGAHFRYAEHLNAACRELLNIAPELAQFIAVGSAEPE
ncbi:MAG: FAD-dependent thymidylate synthase [Chitinispirillaceae bacterium]|nr:FAD-dependent thymidylate synthase [Chitinispirillaceae bacterium]